MRMRTRAFVGLLVVVAIVGTVSLIQRRHEEAREASDRGTLTTSEYVRAVAIARAEIAKERSAVSDAVAYVVEGRVLAETQNLPGTCTSGRLLVVSIVGDFPTIGVSGPPGAPSGPDMWVTVKADPATGEECLTDVGLGRFKATAGSANLVPAL